MKIDETSGTLFARATAACGADLPDGGDSLFASILSGKTDRLGVEALTVDIGDLERATGPGRRGRDADGVGKDIRALIEKITQRLEKIFAASGADRAYASVTIAVTRGRLVFDGPPDDVARIRKVLAERPEVEALLKRLLERMALLAEAGRAEETPDDATQRDPLPYAGGASFTLSLHASGVFAASSRRE
jgi:hypothetical protein